MTGTTVIADLATMKSLGIACAYPGVAEGWFENSGGIFTGYAWAWSSNENQGLTFNHFSNTSSNGCLSMMYITQ